MIDDVVKSSGCKPQHENLSDVRESLGEGIFEASLTLTSPKTLTFRAQHFPKVLTGMDEI